MENESLPPFIKYSKVLAGGRFTTLDGPEQVRLIAARDLYVSEKVDGGNCQIRKSGEWRLLPGSKSRYLVGKYGRSLPWFRSFVGWVFSNHSLYNLPQNVVVFGEWVGNHTIAYDSDRVNRFLLLDVLKIPQRRFLPYEEAARFLQERSIEHIDTVEIKARGKIPPEKIRQLLNEPSDFYAGPKEGLVVKDYSSTPQEFFRLYHKQFSESLPLVPGNSSYFTPSRIIKKILEEFEKTGKWEITISQAVRTTLTDIRREYGHAPTEKKARKLLVSFLDKGLLDPVRRSLIYEEEMNQR